jgi:predicted nuclease with TOPRIM domain
MNPEIEEQQRRASDLKEQLRSLESDEKQLNEKVKLLETRLEVQGLEGKVKVKSDVIDQLRSKVSELEGRLTSGGTPPEPAAVQVNAPEKVTSSTEEIQVNPPQEERQRRFF